MPYLRSVADSLPTPPVVIGHSMGGLVVQKYLESHAAPAGVLLASVPPRGGSAAVLRFARRHPWLTVKGAVTGNTMLGLATAARARKSMFSPATPESLVVRYVARFQQESQRALYLDMTLRALPRPDRVSAPVLVLGAEFDGVITAEEMHATGTAYSTAAQIIPDMGHDMMLESGWELVAQRIQTWVETLVSIRQSRLSGQQ